MERLQEKVPEVYLVDLGLQLQVTNLLLFIAMFTFIYSDGDGLFKRPRDEVVESEPSKKSKKGATAKFLEQVREEAPVSPPPSVGTPCTREAPLTPTPA